MAKARNKSIPIGIVNSSAILKNIKNKPSTRLKTRNRLLVLVSTIISGLFSFQLKQATLESITKTLNNQAFSYWCVNIPLGAITNQVGS